ncbi:MAG: efflux transporter outer membrane subunit [Verrucomicrobiae bacterium]|nr:efflux transporter outer membrane subunit [Verrucomicrobiae bacterium]
MRGATWWRAMAGAGAGFLLAGCAVGPDYRRPEVELPATHRGAGGEQLAAVPGELGELPWWELFEDPVLEGYLREALENNWDVRIAAARVLEAAASLRGVQSGWYPTVAAGGDWTTARTSRRGPAGLPDSADAVREYGSAFVSMPGYELDLWGRLRRATEAARARLLAVRENQSVVRQTLVAEVASRYLTLGELDEELEIALRTLEVRQSSLTLTLSREEGGVASLQDVHQAEVLVAAARAVVSDIRRAIEQAEHALSFLLGRAPGPVARGSRTAALPLGRLAIPAGLPSELLERRPDIRAAEQGLVGANADVGQARAAYYPQVVLTGVYGQQSVALSTLFEGPARFWQFGPSVTVPVFTGGRLRSASRAALARYEAALSEYQQTVQNAFREVSDGLVACARQREIREALEARAEANRRSAELARVRYEGGVTGYLEVLYSDQELFDAELALARARLAEQLALIGLYRALGGGWHLPEGTADVRR